MYNWEKGLVFCCRLKYQKSQINPNSIDVSDLSFFKWPEHFELAKKQLREGGGHQIGVWDKPFLVVRLTKEDKPMVGQSIRRTFNLLKTLKAPKRSPWCIWWRHPS